MEIVDIGFRTDTTLQAIFTETRMWHDIKEKRDCECTVDMSRPINEAAADASGRFDEILI